MTNFHLTRLLFLFIYFFLFFSSCSESEPPMEENIALKSNLQGTWKRTLETGSSLLVNQITFTDYVVTWYDSTVNMTDELNGEIHTVRGKCPVTYTFNDGVQHYNPYNTTNVYSFSETTENNILWVYINDGEKSKMVNYQIDNGVITVLEKWTSSEPIASYIVSSFVNLTDDFSIAEFCIPSYLPYPCITYEKVK